MEHPNLHKFHEICMVGGCFLHLKLQRSQMWLTFASHELHHSNLKKKQTERNSQGFHQLTVHHRNQWSFNMHWCIQVVYIYISQDIARQDIVRTYILTSTYMFTLSLSESCSTWVYQRIVTTKLTTPTSYIPAANIFPETTQSCSFALSFPLLGVNSAIKSSTLFPRIFAMAWYLGVQKFGLSDPHCHYSLEV